MRVRSVVARALLVALAASACGGPAAGVHATGSHPTGTASATPSPRPTTPGPSSTADPCTGLMPAELAQDTGGSYGEGVRETAPESVICTYRRTDRAGMVSIALYTQAEVDAAVAQDPNLAYHDLRGLLEHTREVAERDSSAYVESLDIADGGYAIRSTNPGDTDRLAVIAGSNMVVIAVTDPSVTDVTVRRWMRLVLGRL